MSQFSKNHLKAFINSKPKLLERNVIGGKYIKTLADEFDGVDRNNLSEELYSHDDVIILVRRPTSIQTKCAAILAWGGIRMDNFRVLPKGKDAGWLDVCQKTYDGTLTRKQAFEELQNLRSDNNLKGMGCAFYTKLIYFLQFSEKGQKPAGYIMDQWASESINLLFEIKEPIVKVDTTKISRWTKKSGTKTKLSISSTVSDLNNADDYENFCNRMDQLRHHQDLKMTRAEVDRAIMGNEGKDKNCWRTYVIKQREIRLRQNGN